MPRRLIPPVLPTYLLLVLVIFFAIASAWLGLERLDTIERLDESSIKAAQTVHDLQALQNAVVDIETSARGYVLTGDAADIELYERARRNVPLLLTSLRDRMRDNPEALALVESLVPLIAKRTALSGAAIEQKRSAPDAALPSEEGRPGKEATDAIRAVIAKLEAREQEQLAHDRRALVADIEAARRDRYLLTAVIVLLTVLLFLAVRRLKSLIPPELRIDLESAVDVPKIPVTADGRVASLLQDALLRTRIAAAATPANTPEAERLHALAAAMERARDEHLLAEVDLKQQRPEAENVIEALGLLAKSYSDLGGPTVKATMEQTVAIKSREKSFLIYRAAEWALEAMALRKHSGAITLHFNSDSENASLRILALPDKPDLPLRFTPKESDEANVLQQATTLIGGTFVISGGPMGFAVLLIIPVDR
jgi:CHASE3 domain sensor protein